MSNRATRAVPGTARIEAFSDGVLAIIVTLLIFEIRVPQLPDLETTAILQELWHIAPKLVSFTVSFFTIAIFWVNHHHFFHEITHTDWKLLWHNNLLLFWLTVVPFTTAFIGDYPTQPLVVALYSFVMTMAGLSFTLMGKYAFFKSTLLPPTVPYEERHREYRRSLMGVGMYGLATICAPLFVYLSLLILVLIPLFYVVPNLLRSEQAAQTPEAI